jgi:hypothetical protein
MSLEHVVFFVVVAVAALMVIGLVYWRLPKRLNSEKFNQQWRELQLLCRDKATWREAVIAADRLLDRALRKRRFSGGSMGERLVSAQRALTDHESVWAAHNLFKKLDSNPRLKLKQEDVQRALMAFRQALRDLGALTSEKSEARSMKSETNPKHEAREKHEI